MCRAETADPRLQFRNQGGFAQGGDGRGCGDDCGIIHLEKTHCQCVSTHWYRQIFFAILCVCPPTTASRNSSNPPKKFSHICSLNSAACRQDALPLPSLSTFPLMRMVKGSS